MYRTRVGVSAGFAGLLLSLILVPESRAQDRWVNIAQPGYEPMLMDTNTMVDSGSQHRVWIRRDFKEPQKVESDDTTVSFSFNYSVTRFDIDCTRGRYRTVQSNLYRTDGSVVRSFPAGSFSEEWQSPVPESVGEDMVQGICKRVVTTDAQRPRSSSPQDSVMTRCLAAARLQAKASDELTGKPSDVQIEAREANMVSICKTMPGVYLPELR